MKIADSEILILPGLGDSGKDHWQTRWIKKMATARRVVQKDWQTPLKDDWVATIIQAIEQAEKPVVLVAHSLGVLAAVHAAPNFPVNKVKGAFLVGVTDWETRRQEPEFPHHGFAPIPREKLPFPSMLVTSIDDLYCKQEKSKELAECWGALFMNAGENGHINEESGHGPWPDGLMVFAQFMKNL